MVFRRRHDESYYGYFQVVFMAQMYTRFRNITLKTYRFIIIITVTRDNLVTCENSITLKTKKILQIRGSVILLNCRCQSFEHITHIKISKTKAVTSTNMVLIIPLLHPLIFYLLLV